MAESNAVAKKAEVPDGALINLEKLGVQKHGDEAFEKVAASQYLPRLQLMTSQAEPCKTGKFPVNHYALVRSKNFMDLTKEVIVLIIAWRPKAIRMGDSIISFYNPDHPEFQKIEKDSEQPNSGCMYGPEFLCYIPAIKEYATFFMGTKSSRNESPAMRALLGKGATLRSQTLKNKKFTWQSPQIAPNSSPFDIPEMAEIQEYAEKFNSVEDSEIETAEDAKGEERAR